MAEWRQFFLAAVTTTDPLCLGMVVDEATSALYRRSDELGRMPASAQSRMEGEEITRAAKRLLLLRAQYLVDAVGLNKELDDLLKAQFSLRMQKATQQLTNHSQLRKVRRDIARVRTLLGEKAAVK